jgi:hypothetical protein
MSDFKLAYAASSALTITLASLASDTAILVGRESTAWDNSSNKYLDLLLGGKITTGTSPTAARAIEVWAYAQVEDTPTYPDGITGSDSGRTLTSRDILFASLRLAASLTVTANSNVAYWMGPISIASLFGGVLPKKGGVWVAHNTVAALHATAGNHALYIQPVYATVL